MARKPIHHLHSPKQPVTPTNRWLEYNPYLLGPGSLSGVFAVSVREGNLVGQAAQRDEEGKVFYGNASTGETTWQHPLEVHQQ